MILYLAGGHYTDPPCRWRLHDWLEKLQATHGGPPAFVAAEWSQEVFERGKRQRPLLRQRAESEWPDEETTVWDAIAHCRIANDRGTWAVVVVGAGHTNSVSGSLRQRLEAAGQHCEVKVLDIPFDLL